MSKLSAVLAAAKAENRAALIGYLPAGFPTVEGSIAACKAMIDGGVDIVEIGLPYSDPQMDGPVIQQAVQVALDAGVNTLDVLRVVEGVAATGAPTLVMSYWNPIERFGADRFAKQLAAAGGAGTILPDLIPEEADDWIAAADAHALDRVFLVAQTSTPERITLTTGVCRGFVYAASLMGVTGTRDAVSGNAKGLVERTKAATDVPVCVGLGVSNGVQAAEVAGFADGVIVGSAFVRRLLEAPDEASGLAAVRELARELAAGVRSGRR
ncbi:tryptophan synthase subunit alpha [Actinospica sp. MGRD01-02]|uniref:Tryptophan synthase alpha chain n=1 Tax=Actinospica acidithermotolerans TaxID=2828514 RepID=A0A941IFK9_9ACTN|nr:tryptophan synthase subunit alpha [Actinospica acidithermotolerans]MBR7825164.1 tryptophan synthase subunit alpha [Actinospica acidithermotolerans]